MKAISAPVDVFVSDMRAFKALVGIEPPRKCARRERTILLEKIAELMRKLGG